MNGQESFLFVEREGFCVGRTKGFLFLANGRVFVFGERKGFCVWRTEGFLCLANGKKIFFGERKEGFFFLVTGKTGFSVW